MIQSFGCKDTFSLFITRKTRRWTAIQSVALRKLDQLEAAIHLEDLKAPAGNRLEMLKGNRKAQHSIRINDQWRICFVWWANGPHGVEIVDYHS
ncbi:type II toxin-antitoxin system RelE/ParE family toxin [Granulicella tundricola]|uniref:Plasmid maintenance system killer n=1 Tax=Granulicella tundricola (strain ATCC BAA-1859 / DSM 23138 / MP5ACTX9) TaxID=1198114 RepID=E8X5L6_GRATM|nr:type II toxin-antitoxin system RelE/ParE family toxin [Granulicella tundricola]ADW70643.1 plasmid maintenance system killer [Granulicella tundricola MP5ACTX9]